MRRVLIVWFSAVVVVLLWATVRASGDSHVLDAAQALWQDPWGRATLLDAYFGFAAVYLWMAWRESTWGRRLLWGALVATLGNFAISAYVLLALWRAPEDASVDTLFRRVWVA